MCSPNLKQDLRAHTEEAVHYPECEDHWHTIDVPTRQMLALSHKTRHFRDTNKLKNQGSEATDSWTSTSWKWLWMIGKHRVTRDSNTRWSRRVPCIDGLLPAIKPMRKTSASGCRTYSTLAIDGRRRHLITRKPAPPTCNCDLRQEVYTAGGAKSYMRIAAASMFIAYYR